VPAISNSTEAASPSGRWRSLSRPLPFMEVQMEMTAGIPSKSAPGIRFFEQAHIKDVTVTSGSS